MMFADVIGLLGVFFVLLMYFLLQTGKVNVNSITYSGLNLIGSLLILYSLFYHWNSASVIIEIAWLMISFIGLYKAIKNKRRYNESEF